MSKDADNLDIAQELQDKFNQKGIEASRQHLRQQTDPDFDGKHCLLCSEVLAEQRLSMGRMRCVPCQELLERKSRLYR